MSELRRKKWRFGTNDFNMNIVDYLFKRSISGYKNDSKQFTKKLFDCGKDLYKKDLTAHFGCVNAIEFSGDGNLLFSGGDDRRVLMWNVNDAVMYYTGKLGDGAKPFVMKGHHNSNIFCLAVDDENKRVLSGSNDDRVIVHDYQTGKPINVFSHGSPVFSLSLHPNNGNVFASATEDGRILIYDIRESSSDLLCVAKLKTPFHGVMFNPCEPYLIATANSKVGVHIWDVRKPKEVLLKCSDEHSMAVRWNQSGTILLALRNLFPIVLYDPLVPKRKLEFDADTYFNACTMKSCCFAGDNDEYILSGSDDFNLYMWKIPDPWPESKWVGSEHLALTGHRSIVNQVRYCPSKQLIATSGVEKIIKLWSTFRMPYSEGDLDKPSTKRHRVLCSSRSCTTSPAPLSHDYSQESVEEDTRMIHFFDSLLRNELYDLTDFLFPSEAYFANLFDANREAETRVYEKLIRRKKKHLSRILIDKSDDGKSVCSLSPRENTTAAGGKRRSRESSGSEEDPLSGNFEEDSFDEDRRQGNSSADCAASGSPNCSTFFSSGSGTSNAVSCVNSSSDLSSEQATSDVASSSGRSKVSFELNFTDSDDSNSNGERRTDRKLSSFKDSGINLSESSESELLESSPAFKRKRGSSSRCYRNRAKRRRRCSTTSDSSDSKSESNEADDRFRSSEGTTSSMSGEGNAGRGNNKRGSGSGRRKTV